MEYMGIIFKWELNDKEKEFVKYLVDNEFTIEKVQQYMTKIKFKLVKNNIPMSYEMVSEVVDMESYLKMFDRNWELTKKIYELEKENK